MSFKKHQNAQQKQNNQTKHYLSHQQIHQQAKHMRPFVLKQQPLILFIIVNFCQIFTAFEVYIFFHNVMDPYLPWNGVWGTVIATSIFRIVIFFINTIYMGGFRLMFYSYTLLDILGVLSLTCGIIFVGFEIIITIPMKQLKEPQPIVSYIVIIIQQIFFIGNFRAMMMTCKWGKKRVIFYKIKLYAASLFYIIYGLIYVYNQRDTQYDCTPCNPLNPTCQNACTTVNQIVTLCCMDVDNLYKSGFDKINNVFLLYLATGFAYFCQLIAVMSDFDGIADMNIHYNMNKDEEYQQKCLKNQQLDHSHNNNQPQLPSLKNQTNPILKQQVNTSIKLRKLPNKPIVNNIQSSEVINPKQP